MPTINRFEELEIWQLARMLSAKIYPLTFVAPNAQDHRFKDQIRGTCGSIMDNMQRALVEEADWNSSIVLPLQKVKLRN